MIDGASVTLFTPSTLSVRVKEDFVAFSLHRASHFLPIYVGAYGPHGLAAPSRPSQHIRSFSSNPSAKPSSGTSTPNPAENLRQVTKSSSTPHLPRIATAVVSPVSRPSYLRTESDMNTIPDPRSPSPLHRTPSNDSVAHHPDLSNEVATLSTKLINAINLQTTLDDSLQAARHELDEARARIAYLEDEARKRNEEFDRGVWVQREQVDKMEAMYKKDLTEERGKRQTAEKEKKQIEQELENLTVSLFEEANTMVAAARKERDASEKKIEQLKGQLNDTELLLASQQEQLVDLKVVMEKMSSVDENETSTQISTAPSTPGVHHQDKMSRLFEAMNLTPNTPGADDIPPDHPLRFSHLISPVMRTDLPMYEDFQSLLKTSRTAPSTRTNSGNFGGLNVMGLGAISSSVNASTSSLPSTSSSPATPSHAHNNSEPPRSTNLPPLKDTLFYKRVLAEDIEPCLRLDAAPGLSWLARRTVINSITQGTLTIEPVPDKTVNRFVGPIYPCSLCGEHRRDALYQRKHRFRTSEQEDAMRYPLCEWCLGRVRATCDFVGFLRLIREGVWRVNGDVKDAEKEAWEESVRLRERMFWARLGGGVVPSFVKMVREGEGTGRASVEEVKKEEQEDVFRSDKAKVSFENAVVEKPTVAEEKEMSGIEASSEAPKAEGSSEPARKEGVTDTPAPESKTNRLSLTIPGSFDS